MADHQLMTLPAVVEGKLRAIRRRRLGVDVAASLSIGGSIFLFGLLLALFLDRWLTFAATSPRIVITTAVTMVAMLVLSVTLIRRLQITLSRSRLAGCVDAAVPELEERWTTINRLPADVNGQTTSGREMVQQVVRESAVLTSIVRVPDVVPAATLRRAVLAFAAAAVGVVLFLAADWSVNSVLLQRFFRPASADLRYPDRAHHGRSRPDAWPGCHDLCPTGGSTSDFSHALFEIRCG